MVAIQEVEALSREIVKEFDPERIILFGSYVYGTPAAYSDVDVLVLMDYEGNPFDRSMEMLQRLNPSFFVDLIVRRPDDAKRRYSENDPLIREAFDRGRVLYERNG